MFEPKWGPACNQNCDTCLCMCLKRGSQKTCPSIGPHEKLLCKWGPEDGPIFPTRYQFFYFRAPEKVTKTFPEKHPLEHAQSNPMDKTRQYKRKQNMTQHNTTRHDMTRKNNNRKHNNRKDKPTTPDDTSIALACLGPFLAGLALAWVAFACCASLLAWLAVPCLGLPWLSMA